MRIFILLMFVSFNLFAANVALDKHYTLEPAPNYQLCTNETDLKDLTDGKYSDPKTPFWVQPGCVGWNQVPGPVKITIDLGAPQAVSQVRFSTAGNTSGVQYPLFIDVEVSNDGTNFHTLGSLTKLNKTPLPPADYGYKPVIFDAQFKTVSARYIRIRGIAKGNYFFCDEIEVLSSTSTPVVLDSLPVSVSDDNFLLLASGDLITNHIRQRMQITLNDLTEKLKTTGKYNPFAAEVKLLQAGINQYIYGGNPLEFRSVLPLNNTDRKIFALNAKLLRSLQYPALTCWTSDHFTNLSPLDHPPRNSAPLSLDMYMMNNEYRGAVLNLTNSGTGELNLSFATNGLPAELFEVAYADNAAMKLSPTALLPVDKTMKIPSGFTGQLYIRLNPKSMEPGKHMYKITVAGAPGAIEIPVNLTISKVSFPDTPRLNCGLWDYLDFHNADDGKSRGIYADQAGFARSNQQAYFVNSTFAAPYRSRGSKGENMAEWNIGVVNPVWQMKVGPDGEFQTVQDFTQFDTWVRNWPEAKYYIIFLSATGSSKFGDAAPGSERFHKAVAEFARQWEEHLTQIQLDHKRVVFHLLDEPRDRETYEASKHWISAFKAGSSSIPVYNNPNKFMPEFTDGLKNNDILSPHIELLIDGNRQSADFFRSRAEAGQELWVYSCDEGPFSTAPWYFRRQPWTAFAFGATGSYFWAYGDSSGMPNAFNQYLSDKMYYAPVIIQRNNITMTKHFEAMREGIEDYEYLCILRDLTTAKPNEKAKQLLDESVKEIMTRQKSALDGQTDPAEAHRTKILQMIDELS